MSPRIGGGIAVSFGPGVGGGPAPLPGSIPAGAELVTPWGTALGGSDDALRDTDAAVPWPTNAAGGGTLSIVDATAEGLAGWPMANAMKVDLDQQLRNDKVRCLQGDGVLAQLSAGQYRGYRWYHQFRMPDGSGHSDSQHVVEQNDSGWSPSNGNWVWQTAFNALGQSHAPGEWAPSWAIQLAGSIYRRIHVPSPLSKGNTTYIHEIVHLQVSSTTYKVFYRVSNGADASILYDYDDMVYADLSTPFDDTITYSLNDGIATTRELQLGSNEGPAGGSYPLTWGYYGGVLVWSGAASDIGDVEWAGGYTTAEDSWGGP